MEVVPEVRSRGPFYCHIDRKEQPDGPSLREILSTGSKCPRLLSEVGPGARAHADPHQRERNADTREIIARIQYMNIFTYRLHVQNTVYELRAQLIPPLHVEAILEAATTRSNN
jgi:hypothetical protein